MKKLLMGNEAIALGAIAAGVNVVTGYPGTPSTEVLETVAKNKTDDMYVEWSTNEKCALEVAAGAAYAGAYCMVTMKQVGLNVASDPLMSLAYVGVKGALVLVVADDPGPISSQTEQDTRRFAAFAKLPVFDPSTTEEAYSMIGDAFELSHKYKTPVIFRPTTRVCHGYASIDASRSRKLVKPDGFVRDKGWVIFPRLTYQKHIAIEKRNRELSDTLSDYSGNFIRGTGKRGIAVGGVSWAYACDTLDGLNEDDYRALKVSTPHPFPEKLALKFLEGLNEVLVIEELDPVIERELLMICGKYHLNVNIKGKLTDDIANAGENSVNSVENAIRRFLGMEPVEDDTPELPPLPMRPPVLCAGCPHRASFYAVKTAMKNRKAVFSGDIGCYTLGNAMPLDMVDTCLCMGADVTIAQGLHRIEPDSVNFAFIGDSTFFHTGIPGVINAVYNQTDIVLVVLDNRTTAMTGGQPHPGTGVTMMGADSAKADIKKLLEAIGVKELRVVNPFELEKARSAVKELSELSGVRAVIFEAPCVNVSRGGNPLTVDTEKCKSCGRCVNELGCPALSMDKGAVINPALCNGCGLCTSVCPFEAIGGNKNA